MATRTATAPTNMGMSTHTSTRPPPQPGGQWRSPVRAAAAPHVHGPGCDHGHGHDHDPRPTPTDGPTPPATLLRLMWLASPALPVGGFSYSEGLESAVDAGLVSHEAAAADWLVSTSSNSHWHAVNCRCWPRPMPPGRTTTTMARQH